MSIISMDMFGDVVSYIRNVWDTLTGLIDFITGVFTGNWDKAWKEAKKAFNEFVNVMNSSVNVVISLINGLINTETPLSIMIEDFKQAGVSSQSKDIVI